jgi:F-type H+-transporting ATPase subunit delta
MIEAEFLTDTKAGDEGIGTSRLGKVYAEALLNVAEKRGESEVIEQELTGMVRDLFDRHPTLELLLASRAVRKNRRLEIIEQTFAGRISELMFDFLRVLNSKDRMDLLRSVRKAYLALLDNRAKRVRVRVVSAVALSDEQSQELRRTLSDSLHKEPILDAKVDPALLGGMIVQVGDTVYDSSVRSRIENIRRQLLTRSSYEIQSGRDRFSS